MSTMFNIQHEIANMLDLNYEELDEEQKKQWEQYFDELCQMEANKVDAMAAVIRMQLGVAKAIREESQYLSKRARSIENNIERLKSNYFNIMKMNNINKLAGNTHSISLRNNKSVCVLDSVINSLPSEYCKITIEPKKAEIKKALEAGVVIDGCSIVETQSLQIR